ncbi:tripartite tricarboxylate transporter substrate binding protein [Roseomonas stagni]|uniref:Tripartite tricarboxylate transporter substrate binding protein n=1 Tax=Falsiroseomonas algicola TaxID=2716930 RepID=A0A6M1LRV1_9PROT|nr:tripartite tricarboxylate transporter substrate-binding protein [Falsiroseomonas algicola]NGM22354.1 tripartite tricarboxylate transporter substrate binding protein [Falsiroseomonas algicola]
MTQRRALLASALAGLAVPRLARAQAWPTRPVRIVVPDAPGGGNDSTARIFANHLEQALGQPVPVDNRAGAGGRIGVEHAFRSPGDGTTLLLGNAGSNGINAALYRDLPYNLETSFVPISLLVTGPNVLAVNPRVLPVASVAELLALIRSQPRGHFNYATAGAGSSAHFSAELFKAMTDTDLVHVPFRGAAGMAQAAVAGDAPFLIANMVNVMPFIRRGELRMLAVTSLDRWPDAPEVPTLHESGLQGFETIAWNGLFGPPGLPDAIVQRLLPELRRIGALPEVVDRIKLLGGTIVTSPPEVLAARVRADIAKWKELAQRANIRIDG